MKVDRLISIIMILLNKNRIGAEELANMFSVSKRTIYRDIDAISLAGIPVCAISGVNGGFEIMENYKVENKVFSANDLSAILTGLSGLSDIMKGDELTNALAKVKSFIPADRAKEIELKSNQLHIDLNPWTGNRTVTAHIKIIKTALQKQKVITFKYIALHCEASASRTVEPYQLVLKNSRWYMYAFCKMRNDFRLFKLSRMTDLEICTETVEPRPHSMPILDITDIAEAMQIKITLNIEKTIMDRILDFCPLEDFTDCGDFYCVNFSFIPNDYYYDMLLSFGDKCECLKPPEVRAELQKRIQKLASLYEKS